MFKGGGFTTGGLNCDAKLRRQSIEADDLLIAHAAAMDVCAQALLVGERTIAFLALADLAAAVDRRNLEPPPCSGRQEALEAPVNRYL